MINRRFNTINNRECHQVTENVINWPKNMNNKLLPLINRLRPSVNQKRPKKQKNAKLTKLLVVTHINEGDVLLEGKTLDQLLISRLVARLCQENDLGLSRIDVLCDLVQSANAAIDNLAGSEQQNAKRNSRSLDHEMDHRPSVRKYQGIEYHEWVVQV